MGEHMEKSSAHKKPGRNGMMESQEETEDFYCDVCKIRCPNQFSFDQHFLGKQHQNNQRQKKPQKFLPPSDEFKCTTCQVRCHSQNGLEQHYFGKQHLANLEILKKQQKLETKVNAVEKDQPSANIPEPKLKSSSEIPTSRPKMVKPDI